jgi:iron complex transport system permease protein
MKGLRLKGLGLAALLVAAVVILSLCVGRFAVAPADVWRVIAAHLFGNPAAIDRSIDTVIWQVRLPRVFAGLLVGAALAGSGATYQGMFRNPLVSPDILGVSAGAGLGAIAGIFFSQPVLVIEILAFAGGLGAVALVYAIGGAVRRHDPVLVLVLAGIAVGTLLGAAMSLLKILADPYNQLPTITYWLLGSLTSVNRSDLIVVVPLIAVGLAPLVLLRWRLNLLTLGEDEARALGVDTRKLRALFIVGATLVTSAAVSISGIIGWIGLLIPHIARLMVGPNFARLLPASLLLGGGYLVLVDLLARSVATVEVPLGILTAVLGAPFFLWLLASRGRGWQ